MPLSRRLALLLAAAAGSAVLSAPALAARPSLPNSVSTPHFVVHFTGDPLDAAATTQATASSIAARAERAYGALLADGYAAPLSDGVLGGDSRIDIYISDLSATGALGLAFGDTNAAQTSGHIQLDGTSPEDAFTQHTIAHEVFHLVQYGEWATGGNSDDWLYEGTAEWAGFRVDGYAAEGSTLGPYWLSLDCSDPAGKSACDLDSPYVNGGYSRWPFFQYVAENYGVAFVKDVFAKARTLGTGSTAALAATLVDKGTTLADTYNNWATAAMTGGYAPAVLQGARPTTDGTFASGAKTGTFLDVVVPVNHLATGYLAITRGDGSSGAACYAATMTLTVKIPAGTSSKPSFFWDVKGSKPVILSVSGSTATATVPWDTCTWTGTKGYLALPNASTAVDGADFQVTGTLTVDTSKPTTATPPPALPPLSGVIDVPSTVAPSIELFGPELLKLGAKDTQLRLIVQSDGEGVLQAKLGSVVLGSQGLRAGNNDVRFTLPAGMTQSLRRSAAAGTLLTLTPVSKSGAVQGTAVTRRVSIAAEKAKPTPKKTKKRK